MAVKKITISDALKKYLKTGVYILSFGIVSFLSKKYLSFNEDLSLIFGGLVNFVLFVLEKEIKEEGVIQAIRKSK